jgi:uncharacterized protein with GYD domain
MDLVVGGLLTSEHPVEVSVGRDYRCTRREGSHDHALVPDPLQLHAETWSRLISNPEDRRIAAQQYIESVGGKLHGFWYAFGDHDGYNLWEAPDNVSMAAVALALGAGGALRSVQTTVLITVEETLEALAKAGSVKYVPPGT